MKNLTIISTVFILMFSFCAMADYNSPPGWEDSHDFTHQSWDFISDKASALPAVPDGEPNWINSFGTPGLTTISYSGPYSWTCSWMGSYSGQTRTGFYGGMGDTFLTFYVPNTLENSHWKKQIWIQMTFSARDNGTQPYDIELAHNAAFTDVNDIELKTLMVDEPNGPDDPNTVMSRWYRLTAVYEIPTGMPAEYIRLSAYQYPPDANHSMGGATMIDQVDIDTRYVNIADFDESGRVDMVDFAIFAEYWLW